MLKNFVTKTLVLSLVLGIGGVEPVRAASENFKTGQALHTRGLSLKTSVTAVTDVLQNVARALVNLGPVLSCAGVPGNPVAAVSILGQVMQVAADLQKREEAEALGVVPAIEDVEIIEPEPIAARPTRSKKQCDCPCSCGNAKIKPTRKIKKTTPKTRSFSVQLSPMDRLMGLVIKTAQLPSVSDNSALWVLKHGVIRMPPEMLFQQLMGHAESRKILLKDFFAVLRVQISRELKEEAVKDQAAHPAGGTTAWEEVWGPFLNCMIDVAQAFFNKYIDNILQQDLEQQGSLAGLPPVVAAGVNAAIDAAQGAANEIIDEAQQEVLGAKK